MTTAPFVLVPGHWLGGWAWDRVTPALAAAGHRVTPVTLPGLESAASDRSRIRLADHIAALAQIVAAEGPETVLVAHSGAGKVVSGVLDQNPDSLAHVVYVDSGPSSPGDAADLPPELVELVLPPFDQLQASLDGLSPSDLQEFRNRSLPHPAGPVRDPLRVGDRRRRAVPSTIVSCSFPSSTVAELAAAGHPMFAEVARLDDLRYVDLPTGHWPMWSRPGDLAEALRDAAG